MLASRLVQKSRPSAAGISPAVNVDLPSRLSSLLVSLMMMSLSHAKMSWMRKVDAVKRSSQIRPSQISISSLRKDGWYSFLFLAAGSGLVLRDSRTRTAWEIHRWMRINKRKKKVRERCANYGVHDGLHCIRAALSACCLQTSVNMNPGGRIGL